MERKKKIRLTQIIFLFLGLFTIFFTYLKREGNQKETLISVETKKKIEQQLSDQKSLNDNDTFYNVEYSGFDLNGNRYIIKCKEAVFKLQIKKNFKSEFGNIFVDISLPSIQHLLYFLAKPSWYFFKIFLILFILAILAEFSDIFWLYNSFLFKIL